jgi:hypothetical protein
MTAAVIQTPYGHTSEEWHKPHFCIPQWTVICHLCTSQWRVTQTSPVHIAVNSDTNLILPITASNDTNLICKLHWTVTQASHVYITVNNHTNLTCANCSEQWHKPHLCTSQWPQSSAGKQCRMPTGWAEYLHKTNREVWVCTAPDSGFTVHSLA